MGAALAALGSVLAGEATDLRLALRPACLSSLLLHPLTFCRGDCLRYVNVVVFGGGCGGDGDLGLRRPVDPA